MEDPPNSVVRGGHNIDMGRRGPWWSGGRMEHHCGEARSEVRANKIMQTAWWWSALNHLREEVSFLLPSTTKRRSGRSLQLGKEEPKGEGGEG